MKNVNQLLIDLVQIESISKNENKIVNFVFDLLEKEGFTVQKNTVDDKTFNVIATVGNPKIIFSSHLDTVSPYISCGETATTISGRGACDAKASIAAMIVAASECKNQKLTDFGLIFTVGEETNFRGVKKILESRIEIPFVVVGEPTGLDIVNGHFGILILKLIATGKAAHSSVPETGVNAIEKLLQALKLIDGLQLNKNTIMSICEISGGVADNIIPDKAEVTLSFRIDPADKTDYGKIIQQKVGKLAIVKKGLTVDGVDTKVPKQLEFIKRQRSVKYGTELSFYKNGVVIGPGDIRLAHGVKESINKKELQQAVELYKQIIINYQIK